MTATPPLEQPASAYKAAVDDFIQRDNGSSLTPQEQVDASLPDVQESNTQLLRELMASAKTLTAREDLLNTLRSAREAALIIKTNEETAGLQFLCFYDSKVKISLSRALSSGADDVILS